MNPWLQLLVVFVGIPAMLVGCFAYLRRVIGNSSYYVVKKDGGPDWLVHVSVFDRMDDFETAHNGWKVYGPYGSVNEARSKTCI